MAKPVIATDVPGCRQVVEHGRTGLLCRVRDPQDLAEKMFGMITLPASERRRMGAEGRQKMEREFDETERKMGSILPYFERGNDECAA